MKKEISYKYNGCEKKIGYDYHDRNTIELYYHVDTATGENKCLARCEHCFLRNNKLISDFSQEINEAVKVINLLKASGYSVSPIVSDSFSNNGEYIRNKVFRSLFNGSYDMVWTSGLPIVNDTDMKMLDMVNLYKIKMIGMTSHGIEDAESPMRGLIQPSIVKKAVLRIHKFNEINNCNLKARLTFTIGKWNLQHSQIEKYFDYCEELGISTIRFNEFFDTQGKYPEYVLDKDDRIKAYKYMKTIYDSKDYKLNLSVCEDFGVAGIKVMNFPKEIGSCPAGESLFGVVYPNIYACPVLLRNKVGKIDKSGKLHWDRDRLRIIKDSKTDQEFTGCFAASYMHSSLFREKLLGYLQ